MSAPPAVVRWGWATTIAALSALALALILGGGAPPPAPPGLPDATRLPAWLGLLVGLLAQATGLVTVGFALLAGGLLSRPPRQARAVAGGAAVLWVAITVNQIGLVAWGLEGRADLLDSSRVQALVVQLALVAVTAVLTGVLRWPPAAAVAVLTAVAALLPTVLVGHPRTADHPTVAAVAVSLHVAGVAVWVGGLAALGWLALVSGGDWSGAAPRYSRVALVAVGVLTAAGVLASLGHLDGPAELVTSKYGAIISLKVVLLAALAAAGNLQRRRVLHRTPLVRRHFVGLVALELTVMALAVALAVALGHTPPPA